MDYKWYNVNIVFVLNIYKFDINIKNCVLLIIITHDWVYKFITYKSKPRSKSKPIPKHKS